MKITNKKIIAVLLIAGTLTGCDSLKNKIKGEDTKVEEPTTSEDAAKKEGKEDAEHYESTEKEGKEGEESKDKEGEDSSEAETDPGMTAKERLEDAIFNNRVQARAAEILLEEVPDSLSEETKARLEQLVKDSSDLIEKAEAALQSL
ncbi:hypothetical protein [Anaerococcus degeneri]|uniref:Lipoprotein n=1 Tax=Anaerococcus degeneri TaxID=361500 RepID=A0ABS7YY28_9FIRM|nr:hypothetical protein [Anaerococcus degeneri]MBP2016173.1 putative transcriptional regulator [Anaerococcus degeneri]MCA2096624.1 hypothetical protein [Anaerococcus degeneri]